LEAVGRKVYGWKWECPNGDDCQYKHCLPKGYILQTTDDKIQEEMTIEEYMDLEEQIDAERNRVSANGTMVNDATFLVWKKKRDEARAKEKGILKEEEDKKEKKKTGIQLFKINSAIFKDDDNATDEKYTNDNNELPEEEKKGDKVDGLQNVKINEDLFLDENLDNIDDEIEEKNEEEEEEEGGEENGDEEEKNEEEPEEK